MHLDKDVVPWFQMMQRSHPFHSWVEFTHALELDFGPSIYECPKATLFKLSQTGTVADYYLQFTSLANRVYGLSNDALIDCSGDQTGCYDSHTNFYCQSCVPC